MGKTKKRINQLSYHLVWVKILHEDGTPVMNNGKQCICRAVMIPFGQRYQTGVKHKAIDDAKLLWKNKEWFDALTKTELKLDDKIKDEFLSYIKNGTPVKHKNMYMLLMPLSGYKCTLLEN